MKTIDKTDITAVADGVKALLQSSALPRSSCWLRRRMNWSCLVGAALRRLLEDGSVDYVLGGNWRAHKNKSPISMSGFDPMRLVGPVWEPRVVEAFRASGIVLEQQKHVLSYYLDIAISFPNGVKVNVEVDGRTHLTWDGRRRASDIVRDARLRAEGWKVIRVWVKDLAADFDGVISSLVTRISTIGGK